MDKFEEDEMAVVAEVEDSEAGEVGAAATTAAKCGDAVDKSSPVADLEEEDEIVVRNLSRDNLIYMYLASSLVALGWGSLPSFPTNLYINYHIN